MSEVIRPKYTITLDDDPMIQKVIAAAMEVKTIYFSSSATFLSRSERYQPIGVFIDVHLGLGDSGLDLVPRIRETWPYTPILVVTADPSSEVVAAALAAGANDFLRKPLDPRELLARFQTRAAELAANEMKNITVIGDIKLDKKLNSIASEHTTRYLSHSDFNLLNYLAIAQGTILTKAEIKRHVWGDLKISDNALDKKIFEIRQALKEVSEQVEIKSIYGKGLKLHIGTELKARSA